MRYHAWIGTSVRNASRDKALSRLGKGYSVLVQDGICTAWVYRLHHESRSGYWVIDKERAIHGPFSVAECALQYAEYMVRAEVAERKLAWDICRGRKAAA